jgi:hypothetical protein
VSQPKLHTALPESKSEGSVVSVTDTNTINVSRIVRTKVCCFWSFLNGTISAFEVGTSVLYSLLHVRGIVRKRMDGPNLHLGAETFPLKFTSSVGLRLHLKEIRFHASLSKAGSFPHRRSKLQVAADSS